VRGATLLLLPLIFLVPVEGEEINSPNYPLKKLNGIAAQEMTVKGVTMHTELEKQEKTTHMEYIFVHTEDEEALRIIAPDEHVLMHKKGQPAKKHNIR
jgi:hypothetical protein